MTSPKFEFPSRGFYTVASKVGEAEYFLSKLKEVQRNYNHEEFAYLLSAFASAARSITFSLQAVMSKYPGFSDWYSPHQENLRKNELAKYFVSLRNHSQKVGGIPVHHTGSMRNGEIEFFSYFAHSQDLTNAPSGEITQLATNYFLDILTLIQYCYRDFRIYVDPRAIFTIEGLKQLGWSIEDLEESCGLPRGWTDIESEDKNKDLQRLKILQRDYQGDELMEQHFEKYGID